MPNDDGTISWAELAAETAERLTATGHEQAALEGRWIVMRAAGLETDEWSTDQNELATKRGVAAIDTMMARRLDGEPIQYVLGEWSFRYLDLYIDRRVLIPRPETESLVGAALAEANRLGPDGAAVTAVDLGTGSGAIGLALASEHVGVMAWLTDISSDALAVARANLVGLGRAAERVTIAEGRWFDALPQELRGNLDLVVSNPPYVARHEELPVEVAAWEPASALFAGERGTEDLEHLADTAPKWLGPSGALVLEMAPWQVESISARMADCFADVGVEKDLAGHDRVVVGRYPRPR